MLICGGKDKHNIRNLHLSSDSTTSQLCDLGRVIPISVPLFPHILKIRIVTLISQS